jgi:hypothetical protein
MQMPSKTPEGATESIMTLETIMPPSQVNEELRPEQVGINIGPTSEIDLDLDLEVPAPNPVVLPRPKERPVLERWSGVPPGMDRDDLDMMLDGGLPRSSIVLIEGRKGTVKVNRDK